MRYVLFSEDPNTHREVYVGGIDPFLTGPGRICRTFRVSEARAFTTARDAYEYGRKHRLLWWKVGAR